MARLEKKFLKKNMPIYEESRLSMASKSDHHCHEGIDSKIYQDVDLAFKNCF